MQVYVEIALDLNPKFYIWLFSKFISQLKASYEIIIKVMRLLYNESEVNNYQFAIDHLYYI